MSPAASPVRSEDAGEGVRAIVLNRPRQLNAIDLPLLQGLVAALQAALADAAVRVILLRGEGRSFCAGDDLVAQLRDTVVPDEAHLRRFVAALQDVTRLIMFGDKPVLALVQGWAIGGGFSWTQNADLAIWAEDARATLPELSFGLFVSGGLSLLLPRSLGRMGAAELVMTAPTLTAPQLREWGLARQLVPAGRLLEAGHELANRLAALPEGALRAFKRALLQPDREALEAALALEAEACLAGAMDPATRQRVEAFLARRP